MHLKRDGKSEVSYSFENHLATLVLPLSNCRGVIRKQPRTKMSEGRCLIVAGAENGIDRREFQSQDDDFRLKGGIIILPIPESIKGVGKEVVTTIT